MKTRQSLTRKAAARNQARKGANPTTVPTTFRVASPSIVAGPMQGGGTILISPNPAATPNATATTPAQSTPSSGIPIPGLGGGVTVDDALDVLERWEKIFGDDKSTRAPGSRPDRNTQPGNNLPSPSPLAPQLGIGTSGGSLLVAVLIGAVVGFLAKSFLWGAGAAVLAFFLGRLIWPAAPAA